MMEIKQLTSFYDAIKDDARIGPTHISLYMALFQFYNQNGWTNPVAIGRKKIMEAAKISGLGTFHKSIKDLCDFGYIRYFPSYNSKIKSKVFLLKLA